MKTLNDVINAVQYETQLSRSQLSLKIGKSRNYLSEVLRSGVSHEKEQEIINLLLDLVDDEIGMLRNVLADKEETIEAYKVKLKEIISENLDIVKEKNDEIKTLKEKKMKRHMELIEHENKYGNIVDNLNETIATKNLFIDGLDMENKGLMDRISKLENDLKHMEQVKDKSCELNDELIRDSKKLMSKISDLEKDIGVTLDNEKSLQKTIESLAKAGHSTGKQLNKEINKNRILTASIIGLVAIFSVYLWVK